MPSTRNMRNLNNCFSDSTLSKSPPTSPTAITTTTSATSSHQHHHKPSPSTSPTSFMIKNFNSLYDPSLNSDHTLCSSSLSTTFTISTSFNLDVEPEPELEPVDFAAAFASQRFFFSSPGSSNSLVEYTDTNCKSNSSEREREKKKNNKKEEKEEVLFNGSVAVPTYSPDPYTDFRRSMQEMVEARPELMDVKSNWNILHELLLCYLALNPKNTHKFILGAFADLLVTLISL
ncbi:transcription repressor OFP12-like [Vicia villosa]|uniref:transcription repressor OFP12-like n=1 Tax=Vicia villosa TaxID=3911 RepID=UPI00273A8EF4|nr:transcription repressor OFP12-like [Vicia villosa]